MNKKTDLLISTKDILIVLTPLAVLIGDREAIALQQVHYWLDLNETAGKAETHYFDGAWWTYNTWKGWKDNNFPFWSIATIQRVFESLANKGLVKSLDHDNRNKGKWVTVCYDTLNALQDSKQAQKRRDSKRVKSRQTDNPSDDIESSQTDKTRVVKLTTPDSQTDMPVGTTDTNAETSKETNFVAPNGAAREKPKPRSATVRSKPISKAEQHPLRTPEEWAAIRAERIKESTAQNNREMARQRNFAALEKAVKVLPGVSGKLATQYAHMLNGTATKGVYSEYRIEGGITAIEFETFVQWYSLAHPNQGLPKVPETLYGYICEWVDAGKPAAPQSKPRHADKPAPVAAPALSESDRAELAAQVRAARKGLTNNG